MLHGCNIAHMGFVNAAQRRAYQQGYQAGVQIPVRADWEGARRRLRRRHRASLWLDTIMRGFLAGVSARRGDEIARRKARWYLKNRERIVARQRRQRRALLSAQALAIAARITSK